MIDYARLRPGRGFEPGRAAAYYAQRLVTGRRLRGSVSRCLAAAIRLRQGAGTALPAGEPPHPALAGLRQDGLAMLDGPPPPADPGEMLAYFRAQRVVGPGRRLMRLEEVEPGTSMASYPLSTVVACPGLMEAINAPGLLRLVAGYLGCKPTISSLGVRWSLPAAARPEATQLFHRDPDDWRFLKLFVYLTDVGAEDGPHVYVRGSHNTAAQLRARPYQRAALEREYGPRSIRTVTGPAGTTFVADTHGIHMGLPPAGAPRLILQVQYSILPIFAFRYAPVAAPLPAGLDPYVNRLIMASPAAEAADLPLLGQATRAR
ncbi:phytanoyl-CoA dioxygenase family protein [Muricoccus nepalensis]|uniref:phytanoyl-CoA dioxygenase family protein n=1 Tax=Muricoccus nepalensis TaxID=1854500 RepID=UPI001883F0AC|nr:phytanoyl-CoA dioxygenase family protein [Roseomonas nepalensis]